MLSAKSSLKDSVELIKLKTDKLNDGKENGFLLKDDIWGKGTLLLKSGVYLTEEIINKLLKFGVRKVNIAVNDLVSEEIILENKNNSEEHFIRTQSVLILEKNLINASMLVRQLVENGFRQGNIFVTKEPAMINSYFRAKQINFLFIDEDLYGDCAKCAEKFSLLRNTHAFVTANGKNVREFKKSGISKIKFLKKPAFEETLNMLISEALNQNYLDFLNENEEEVLIS